MGQVSPGRRNSYVFGEGKGLDENELEPTV